ERSAAAGEAAEAASTSAAPAAAAAPGRTAAPSGAARTAVERIQAPQHDPGADAAVARPIAAARRTTEMRQDDEADDEHPEDHGQRASTRMLPLLLGVLGGGDILLRLVGRQA